MMKEMVSRVYTKRFLSTEPSYKNMPRGLIEVNRIRSSADRFDVPWGVAQVICNIYYLLFQFLFSGLVINRKKFIKSGKLLTKVLILPHVGLGKKDNYCYIIALLFYWFDTYEISETDKRKTKLSFVEENK